MEEIYLDNASTTPIHPRVAKVVGDSLIHNFGNPSSLHRMGIQAEKKIKEARESVSSLIKTEPEEIVFTSGGTESNNISIIGSLVEKKRKGMHCITTVIEHPSVINTFKYLETVGWDVSFLPVNKNGVLELDELKKALRRDTVLVSIMHVNNEIGSIQPVREIGEMLLSIANKPIFHVDAVQSFGKLNLRPKEWGVDLLSISGHKIHAPKGIGALYIKKGERIQPLLWGGGQERGMRSGTENLSGIIGLGEAVRWIEDILNNDNKIIYDLKRTLVEGICSKIPMAIFNGPKPEEGAPHIINVSFPGIKGEVLLHTLEANGVFVSTGSACSSRKKRISHVLQEIGVGVEIAEGAIRISLSYMNTEEEIHKSLSILNQCINQLELFKRR